MELKVKTIKSGLIRGVITAIIMIAITYAVVLKDLGMLRSMISATIIAVAVTASSAIYDY